MPFFSPHFCLQHNIKQKKINNLNMTCSIPGDECSSLDIGLKAQMVELLVLFSGSTSLLLVYFLLSVPLIFCRVCPPPFVSPFLTATYAYL